VRVTAITYYYYCSNRFVRKSIWRADDECFDYRCARTEQNVLIGFQTRGK